VFDVVYGFVSVYQSVIDDFALSCAHLLLACWVQGDVLFYVFFNHMLVFVETKHTAVPNERNLIYIFSNLFLGLP
jgi:hypothetical protein